MNNVMKQKQIPPIVLHYTCMPLLPLIMKDCRIKTETETTDVRISGMLGGAWFSLRQDYEPTAFKLLADKNGAIVRTATLDDMLEMGMGRIGVKADAPFLLTWADFKKRCISFGCLAKSLRSYEITARRQGANPDLFRVSLGSVNQESWVAVQVMGESDNGQWKPFTADKSSPMS